MAKDPNSDGLLVIMTPQGMTDPTAIAQDLKPYAKLPGKPILATWMGGNEVAAGEAILNGAGIPTFLPRHRGQGVQLHVALQLQSPRPLRNANAG